jgi:alpha-amylase
VRKISPGYYGRLPAAGGHGCVEFLNEADPHSLAFLFSPHEFREQIEAHKKKIQELFGQNPTTFHCTDLIYSNELAGVAEEMGHSAFLAEGGQGLPGFQGPDFVYQPADCARLKLLLRNYHLSADIRLHFADGSRDGHPFPAGWFAERIVHSLENSGGQMVNLFLDYETSGKYLTPDRGNSEFLQALSAEMLGQPDFHFQLPAEIAQRYDPQARLDVTDSASGSDIHRNLTTVAGNAMQQDALRALYDLEETVRKRKDADCLAIWRMLQTSDYFHYMCTEGFADRVRRHDSSPYGSPYEAYINYMNILEDFSRTPSIIKAKVQWPENQNGFSLNASWEVCNQGWPAIYTCITSKIAAGPMKAYGKLLSPRTGSQN